MTDNAQSNERSSVNRKLKPRKSSFFNVRRHSFFRSKGTRGADVETLRGNTGASFEGYARVARCGDYMKCCGMKFGTVEESSSKKPRFLLIKGNSLFAFISEDAPTPKYAISLARMQAEAEEESHGYTDVLLKTSLGDVEYRIIFNTKEDKASIDKFLIAVRKASSGARTADATRASTAYANDIAMEKVKDQPDAPINIADAMSNMPSMYPV